MSSIYKVFDLVVEDSEMSSKIRKRKRISRDLGEGKELRLTLTAINRSRNNSLQDIPDNTSNVSNASDYCDTSLKVNPWYYFMLLSPKRWAHASDAGTQASHGDAVNKKPSSKKIE